MNRLEDVLSITHDLKNPLLAIRRLSERLMDDAESVPESTRRKLELIHESALKASGSLEKLEDSAKQGAKANFSPEPVDLAKLARKVVRRYKVHAEHKSQTLEFSVLHPEEEKFLSHGDPSQIQRAMENLVSNALKYSPHGETVEVWVGRGVNTVSFSVTDNGPGIAPKEQEHLFAPFEDGGPDPTGDEESSGIGLYLVKQILERHDGEVELESSKGDGSTFTLLFPAGTVEPSSAPKSCRDHQVQEVESTLTDPVA